MFWWNQIKEKEKRMQELVMENYNLTKINRTLKKELEENTRSQLKLKIDYRFEDPSPLVQQERAGYVARVAAFYKEVLEPKLKHMISEQQAELSVPTSPRDLDLINKGSINAFSLLMDWGEEMINEHVANQDRDINNVDSI